MKGECVSETNCYLFLSARGICTQCDIKESILVTPYILREEYILTRLELDISESLLYALLALKHLKYIINPMH